MKNIRKMKRLEMKKIEKQGKKNLRIVKRETKECEEKERFKDRAKEEEEKNDWNREKNK